MDEATSALDSESEHYIQRALAKFMGSRTSVVIAHRLSTIKQATQIHVIQKGSVVESGTHDELLSLGGAYTDLAKRQFNLQEAQSVQEEVKDLAGVHKLMEAKQSEVPVMVVIPIVIAPTVTGRKCSRGSARNTYESQRTT